MLQDFGMNFKWRGSDARDLGSRKCSVQILGMRGLEITGLDVGVYGVRVDEIMQ